MSLGDVQRLRAFALVLDLGSISAAADVLGYTQSAVSQQLAALEREVGALVIEVLQLEPHEAVERLRGGDADLAVIDHMPGLAVPETGGLQRRRLLVDHLYVVLPDGHRLARRDAVSVTDLERE